AGGLHHHQLHLVLATEGGKLGNACGIVGEAGKGLTRHNAGIEVLLRNIYSTDSLGHGNLPCSCVCEPATFRSCVRTAKIPSSPTVVAGGWTGDIAERGAWRPPGPSLRRSLNRIRRQFPDTRVAKGRVRALPVCLHSGEQDFCSKNESDVLIELEQRALTRPIGHPLSSLRTG